MLLTDIVMPVMGGLELAERIGLSRPDTRITYMSGYAADHDLVPRELTDEEGFLQKPFDRRAVLCLVRKALRTETVDSR